MKLALWTLVLGTLALSCSVVDAKSSSVVKVGTNSAGSLQKKRDGDFNSLATAKLQESPQITAAMLVSDSLMGKLAGPLKLGGLFAVWYAFNAGYNVYNAYVKKDFPKPWTISTLQLLVGLIYALPLWASGLRALPKLTMEDIKLLFPIALLNAGGHTAAVIAMFQKGGGSFTHVIKASEPVVSTILNLGINKIVPAPFTAVSLLPITYGVAYASTLGQLNVKTMSTELTTLAAKMAMISNVGFSLRSILRKNLPKDFKSRTNLDPANEHAVTTLFSTLLMIPLALALESPASVMDAYNSVPDKKVFAINTFICGMCYYMYNEMQNKVLGALGPVPTAVGNTLKRVVIFVALYLFTSGESFPPAKVLGCAIAVAGCLAYAICDSKKI